MSRWPRTPGAASRSRSRCGCSPAGSGRTPARSSPCSRPGTAGGTRCGSLTCPPPNGAGGRGCPTIDAARRVHARVEDRIRTGKDCGIGHFPSRSLAISTARLTASLLAATLLAWLRHLGLDGDLAKAEPKALRYRVLHAAARLVRGARRRQLRIPATWPWAADITAAWQQITALPQAP